MRNDWYASCAMPENRNGTGTHRLALAGEGTRFKPGQSGNPGGRPKGAAKAFREALPDPTLAALGLLELAQDPDVRPADRISAWNSLLDRGYGKAASFAAIEGADPLEQDEVAAEIRAIAAQLEADRAA